MSTDTWMVIDHPRSGVVYKFGRVCLSVICLYVGLCMYVYRR